MRRWLTVAGTLGLLVLAVLIRASHLDWGFPEIHEEATPVREAIEFWGTPGGEVDLNPGFFKYPSFSFYINYTGQIFWYLWLSVSGEVTSLNDFRQLLATELPRAVFLGRWIQVLLGALVVLPVLRLGNRLGGTAGGWFAGALIAVLPMAVVESQQVGPDVTLMLCTALGLLAATRVAEEGERSHYLWCGLWIGLGAAAKYPGVLLLAALLSAHVVQVVRRRDGPVGLLFSGFFWQGLVTAGLVFMAASPYVLLDLGAAIRDITFEKRHMAFGHLGREEGRAISYYLLHAIPRGWTPVVLVASLLGVGGLMARGSTRARTIPGLVFAMLSLLILGSWKMGAPRYVLPLAPLAAVWTGALIGLIGGRIRNPRVGVVVMVIFGFLITAWPLASSVRTVTFRGRQDSRLASGEWIEAHVPEKSALLVERYGPEPSPERFLVLYLPFHGVNPHIYDLAYLPELYATFDYVVLSSGVSARYLARAEEYQLQAAFYSVMDRHYDEVARFHPGTYVGPQVRILKRRETQSIPDASSIPKEMFADQQGNSALAEHLSALGTILVRQGKAELGFALLQSAVDLSPTLKTWGNLGSMWLGQARFEDALIAFRRARDLAPEDPDVWFNLGTLFSKMGEHRQAVDAFEQALGFRPEMEDAYIGLARSLIEDNRLALARSVLEGFLQRFPRSPRRKAAEEVIATLRQLGPGRP